MPPCCSRCRGWSADGVSSTWGTSPGGEWWSATGIPSVPGEYGSRSVQRAAAGWQLSSVRVTPRLDDHGEGLRVDPDPHVPGEEGVGVTHQRNPKVASNEVRLLVAAPDPAQASIESPAEPGDPSGSVPRDWLIGTETGDEAVMPAAAIPANPPLLITSRRHGASVAGTDVGDACSGLDLPHFAARAAAVDDHLRRGSPRNVRLATRRGARRRG